MKITSFICRSIFSLLLLCSINAGNPVCAAGMASQHMPQYVDATVENLENTDDSAAQPQAVNKNNNTESVTLELTSGPDKGKKVTGLHKKVINMKLHPGDRVIVSEIKAGGQARYEIMDYQRLPYVYALFGIFVLSLLVIGRKVGLKSLFVIVFAVAVILKIMIPLIISGLFPIPYITLAISALIAVVTQITISGCKKAKTWGAILGTVGGVATASILTSTSIIWMHLTGLYSDDAVEEALMLKSQFMHALNVQDLLFAGIVLGALGAIMDVAISIASSLQEIKLSNPQISRWKLFSSGLNIGKDIMGAMTNTLILAYLGSFLPLILLFSVQQDTDMLPTLNMGMIITEVVRALTGSIGLIFTIPITAAVTACLLTIHDFKPKLFRKKTSDMHDQL